MRMIDMQMQLGDLVKPKRNEPEPEDEENEGAVAWQPDKKY